MPIFASTFSTGHWMVASSSGFDNVEVLDFGFKASEIYLVNACGDRIWFDVAGCAPTTTGGFIQGCSAVRLSGLAACGLGLKATSTSTGATARPLLGVMSWGP